MRNRQLPIEGSTVTDSPSNSMRHSLRPNGRLTSVPQPQAHRCSAREAFEAAGLYATSRSPRFTG